MPNFNLGTLQDIKRSWQDDIVDKINDGKALPFISNSVADDLFLGDHAQLAKLWANFIEYPFADPNTTLTQMAQYQSIASKAERRNDVYVKEVYLGFLERILFQLAEADLLEELNEDSNKNKFSFSEKAERLQCPDFDSPSLQPLKQLAQFPLPIYLTTSYHSFLEVALRKVGKRPRSEICYWHPGLADIPSVFNSHSLLQPDQQYRPSEKEPLVYHLHGLDAYPSSLVLTEDDCLDFLITISNNNEAVHPEIQGLLGNASLLLMGYSLYSWDFRVLFRGLIKPTATTRRPKSASILQGSEDPAEKAYFENYLIHEADFEVYWGSMAEFVDELWQRWLKK